MRPGFFGSAGRYEILGETSGALVSLSGTANSKPAYANIGTASFAYDHLAVSLSAALRNSRVDIAINNGGADEIIVEDFPVSQSGNPQDIFQVTFPIRVPSGAVVKARAQSRASGTILCGVAGYAGGRGVYPPRARVRSLVDWTGTNPGVDPNVTASLSGTPGTYTAWTQMMASTPARIGKIWFWAASANDVSRTAGQTLIEIGVGAAAAEQGIAKGMFFSSSADFNGGHAEVNCDIPAGTRLSFRATSSGAGTDTIACVALGLAA